MPQQRQGAAVIEKPSLASEAQGAVNDAAGIVAEKEAVLALEEEKPTAMISDYNALVNAAADAKEALNKPPRILR